MTSILSTIGRIATEFSAARARYRTERVLRSLPHELRKDIGWPEVADATARRPVRGLSRAAGHAGAA